MMKKYFTDGLIQIAILLSLLRTELNQNYLNNYYNNYPEIQEIILGSSSAYTQTNFHNHNWHNGGFSGYSHPKSIDNYYANSVFRELHSLSPNVPFDRVDQYINAWLVTGPANLLLPSESANDNSAPSHESAGSHSHGSPSATTTTNNDPNHQSDPVGATGPVDPSQDLPLLLPGSELTKEDMDLIEILWRQDMDLGVRREMYDLNMRRELEKERELEQLKQQKEEEELQKLQQQEQSEQSLPDTSNYIVDGETGELIPIPPSTEEASDATVLPGLSPQLDQEGFTVEEAMHLLEQQDPQQTQLQQPQQPPSQTTNTATPTINPSQLEQEIEAIIASAQRCVQQNETQGQPPHFERQNSFERQWQEVEQLLNASEELANFTAPQSVSLEDTASSAGVSMATAIDNSNVLLQNATMPAVINSTNTFTTLDIGCENPTPQVSMNFSSMMPTHTATNETFEPFPQNNEQNTSLPDYDNLFNLDTQDLMFGNVMDRVTDANSTLDHTENLLQQLMGDNYLPDMDFTDTDTTGTSVSQELQTVRIMDDVSSDSAVSSMSCTSPTQDVDDSSNYSDQSSPYDGLQGATGGSDLESSTGETNKQVKYESFTTDYNYNFGHHTSDSALNQSSASNDSDSDFAPANMRHVKHNHTYPLQPGQQTREARKKKNDKCGLRTARGKHGIRITSSRDEKKAKMLKIPISTDDIIHSPVEEFNELLQKYKLSEQQLQLIRDIRRRGKNKLAAQNCRKRKLEVITTLEEEVIAMRHEKQRLLRERETVEKQRDEFKNKLSTMYNEVFHSLRDDHGQPYDPNEYSLQQGADGNVFLVPRNGTQAREHEEKSTKKKKQTRKH